MKLISMTDFVLEQEQPTYLEKEEFEDVFYKIHNYANFLKQPLELGMFVPTDENGNFLWDEANWNKNFYQRAKERVLFEGFRKENYNLIGDFQSILVLPFNNGNIQFHITDHTEEKQKSVRVKTIEDLIAYNLTLAPTAIKQLS